MNDEVKVTIFEDKRYIWGCKDADCNKVTEGPKAVHAHLAANWTHHCK